ncbi:pleckstrin homology domain-containing family F member 2 isoform X3 [Maniola hyperantus]|uniref:pleckstrin homology domain-containing family F member 2 isoform X3 n=1 Tax=Aphantopus hyperantus TaxID=2795564 RepID=UPI001568B7C1|nr:pleckstrin homology domain-containing family F member 2 isoform X3 [Maniola hyperantus]
MLEELLWWKTASAVQPLAEQGRVLVGEGVLTKMCRKKPKARQFFLFNDILVYGNIVINKKKYNKQHVIPLEEVKLESLKDEGQYRNGWLIRTASKSFAVYAATATEKEEWMAHIEKCIEDLLRKSGKQPPLEHAAVWVPDNEAAICMHCKKTQFTVLNRRHHCRKCGSVVCGPCSSKRFVLRGQSEKPLRVCLQCYDELTRDRARPAQLQPTSAAVPIKGAEGAGSGGDSSADDDSDDDDDRLQTDQSHDEPKFYGDGEKTEETNNHSSKENK